MINSLQPPILPLARACSLCPPLAQACSLCPIQNSQFSPRPIRPICPTRPTRPTSPIIARVVHTPGWRKLVACAQFKIHNS